MGGGGRGGPAPRLQPSPPRGIKSCPRGGGGGRRSRGGGKGQKLGNPRPFRATLQAPSVPSLPAFLPVPSLAESKSRCAALSILDSAVGQSAAAATVPATTASPAAAGAAACIPAAATGSRSAATPQLQ